MAKAFLSSLLFLRLGDQGMSAEVLGEEKQIALRIWLSYLQAARARNHCEPVNKVFRTSKLSQPFVLDQKIAFL